MGSVVNVHRLWLGDEPHPAAGFTARAIQSTMDATTGRLIDWTQRDAMGLVDDVLVDLGIMDDLGHPDVLDLLGSDPRHISNVFRYAVLWAQGGLWLDHDVLPLMDLRSLDGPWTAGFRATQRREGCVLWFPQPEHHMLDALLKGAVTPPNVVEVRSDRGPTRQMLAAPQDAPHRSGAHLLTKVGAGFPGVSVNHRVLPFDSTGRLTYRGPAQAVHLWEGSRP